MGRSAADSIQHDHAFDQYWLFTSRMERELAYLLAPEHVVNDDGWLAQVFAVVELMLLFEQYEVGGSSYIDNEQAVQRWRDVFLGVWDGEWQDDGGYGTPYLYGKPEYRQQHRPVVAAMFDRLESLARYYGRLASSDEPENFTPLLPAYPLPYFSIRRWTNQHNITGISIERFTSDLIEHAAKEAIYWLSSEKRGEITNFPAVEVWVAVDILGFLCETYEKSPGINQQAVRMWRETAIEIWKQFLDGDENQWDETDPLYLNVMAAFDRLEAVAQKYPAYEY